MAVRRKVSTGGCRRSISSIADGSSAGSARSPNDHLAFGQGPHLCLGATFARLQMQAFFGELLAMGELRLDGAPRRLTSNFINGLTSLPVRWT